ncbi:hypothetical protein E2562_008522 [Oryza meyeriana var. granulata]|uniref:Disease resistance N-terminal domain-containing protein n=1 Tax=Oryza meyeriana var. granulata TaxID=110450 RepID=A0A6G1C571_9ORYZ|nr:hypothetical protein E2562_008522 [Oryza meyeriana var. granulata]
MAGVGEKMIVGALTGVMGPVLGKLSSLMEQEYFKLKGVRGRMVQLSQELIAINVALDKHAAMDSPDVHVKAWVKEIRELAYDIEDCIDLFVNHEPAGASGLAIGVKRLLRDSIGKLRGLHHRHKFADQIQDLKDVAADIYERKVKYKLDDCSSATTHEEIDPRLPWIFEEAEELVGMERRTEKFINQFVDYSTTARQRSVVSIFGPGGLGKTTLAYQYKPLACTF